MYIIEGITYTKACEIIDNLKSKNIEANIMVGGIGIYPQNTEEEQILFSFVKENNLCIEQSSITSAMQEELNFIKSRRK